jgi:ribosomal protein L7Ae-like RNA K-turn-binding protein
LSPEEKKVFNLFGIATKSRKLVSGEFSTEKAVKEKKAALVIVAEDASDNTKKMFTNMCTYYNVPIYFFGIKDDLGHAMGKEFRASLAVLDKGLADAIDKQLKMMQDRSGGSKYGENEDIRTEE